MTSRTDLILRQLDGLPTLPAVAVRVLEASGEDAGVKDVARVVESDPALSARILQLAGRADIGVRPAAVAAGGISRAVVMLGVSAVRAAVIAIGVFEVFPPHADKPADGTPPFDREGFWTHCLAVACGAELLAERVHHRHPGKTRLDPAEAFTCGLLHDLGKLAFDAALPKSFGRVVQAADAMRGDIAEIERQVIGIDHHAAGRRLAERWGLPRDVAEVCWHHNAAPDAIPPELSDPRLVHLVTLADGLARSRHLGFSGNHTFGVPRETLLDVLGLTQADLDHVADRLVGRMEPRASALGLGEAASAIQLYRKALERADRELARSNTQLAGASRRLRERAEFFEALARFQHELRPDAPVRDAMTIIAQTAAGVLDVPGAAVFSLPPTAQAAETLLASREGRVLHVGVSGADDPGSDAPLVRPGKGEGDGPIHPVGHDLEWLVSTVGPRLGGTHRWWLRLVAEGQTIGGIVWGAGADETTRAGHHARELVALSAGWSLALRTCQIRDESRSMADKLAESNRQLVEARDRIARDRTLMAVAELAAGAAHEMNNPLMVISGRSQLLYHGITDAKLKASAKLIWDNAQRLSDMITGLMNFAKPARADLRATWVDRLVAAALETVKKLPEVAGEGERHVELSMPQLPAVRVDPVQTARAIAAVLLNAHQATQGGTGRIEVHAAHDAFGGKVVLTITDNGCGMDARTLSHAFDPFFSRKAAGRRRGMGLPTALRQLEASGGSLRLDSRVGAGTRVVISLPVAEVAAEPAAAEPPPLLLSA